MQLGDFEVLLLGDGTFRLDGGAMFGIVPKPLWLQETPCDERNRIELACNCPLIRTGRENILIDCGLGRKWNEKQQQIYAIDTQHDLLQDLAAHGLQPEDITILIHSHLHLDHTGWSTRKNAEGSLVEVFPNARHLVERHELEAALNPNEVTRGTYLDENIALLAKHNRFEIFEDRLEVVPGVKIYRTGGHTLGHCAVEIGSMDQRALFVGETMPTSAHRHLPWIMAYDLYPLDTLKIKRALLRDSLRDRTLLLLNHDPKHKAIRLREGERGRLEIEPVA